MCGTSLFSTVHIHSAAEEVFKAMGGESGGKGEVSADILKKHISDFDLRIDIGSMIAKPSGKITDPGLPCLHPPPPHSWRGGLAVHPFGCSVGVEGRGVKKM